MIEESGVPTLLDEFIRWLAAHDAEVRAAALEEAAQIADAALSNWYPDEDGEGGAAMAESIANQIRARATQKDAR